MVTVWFEFVSNCHALSHQVMAKQDRELEQMEKTVVSTKVRMAGGLGGDMWEDQGGGLWMVVVQLVVWSD